MSCENIPSVSDVEKTKLHIDDFSRLVGGTESGYSTNGVTGETRPTWDTVMKDLGFKPGPGDFTTGFTVMQNQRNYAWYDPTSNNWYSYLGTIPESGHVVSPGTDPTDDINWKPVTDQLLREQLAEPSGAGRIGLSIGTVANALHYITPEMFGAVGDGAADDTVAMTACINHANVNNLNVRGDGVYKISTGIVIPEVHIPAVRYDWTRYDLNLNKIIYTATSGTAIHNKSPACLIEINEMEGTAPFTGVNETIGFELFGAGYGEHYIGSIHGFGTNILFRQSYTRAVNVGESFNSMRGALFMDSNANKLRGRIGGGFGETAIDATTCDIGVEIQSDSSANDIEATIEYCRRTVNSRPFLDVGTANRFLGYIESCSTQGSMQGGSANFKIFNGATNVRDAYGFTVGGTHNKLEILNERKVSGVADGVNNALTLQYLQSIQSTTATSEVFGAGHNEQIAIPRTSNLTLRSNDLTAAPWNLIVNGGAAAGDISRSFIELNSGASIRYRYGTRFACSRAATNEEDVYRIGQNITVAFTGDISAGFAVRLNSGDVDFMLRVQGTVSSKIYTKSIRLTGSSKIIEISHNTFSLSPTSEPYLFELSFRTWSPSNFDILNTFLCTAPNVTWAPASVDGGITPFQPWDKNAKFIPTQLCKGIVAPVTLNQFDFDTYVINAGDGNIMLNAGYNGQIVHFYKNGVSNTNLLSANNINGTALYAMNTDRKSVTLQFIGDLNTWVILAEKM